MDVCIVGLGKIGLPLAARVASRGHFRGGLRHRPGGRGIGEPRGVSRSAVRRAWRRSLRACPSLGGRLRATTDTAGGRSGLGSCRSDRAGVPDRRPPGRLVCCGCGRARDRRRPHRGYPGGVRDDAPGGHDAQPAGPDSERWVGLGGRRRVPLLAFSPERISSGSALADLASYPKVVGADDERSAQAAARFYATAVGARVLPVASTETAELVKLMELTYRDVNIASGQRIRALRRARGSRRYRGDRRGELAAVCPRALPGHRRRRPLRAGEPLVSYQRTGPRTAGGARAPHQRRHAEPSRAPPGAGARRRGGEDDSNFGTGLPGERQGELPIRRTAAGRSAVGSRRKRAGQ